MPLFLRRPVVNRFSASSSRFVRTLRSDAALAALRDASEVGIRNLILYNYPSFSGAFGSLFAHLYHSRLNIPCLILPFSSAVPFSIEDLCIEGLRTCYFLDFVGPKGFALELSKHTTCKVIGFDHRRSALSRISLREYSDENLMFHVNPEKSSAIAVYEYFSAALFDAMVNNGDNTSLLNPRDCEQIKIILEYIEDLDLLKWRLPDVKAFKIGLSEWRSKFNCIANSSMYQQLMEMSSVDLIKRGNAYISSRQADASKLLHKVFRVHLGRGFYGECLGFRADGNLELCDEIGIELSRRSSAAGLRPIGAVIYMQRKNLKMCLRTTDSNTNTSEIAKAYGGGGSPSSSSFIIRMDEYNHWLSVRSF